MIVRIALTLGLFAILSFALFQAVFAAGPTAARRLISAELRIDGELVLSAFTSDDGYPDADEVWSYLARLEFERTPEAEETGLSIEGGTLTLRGKPDERPGLTTPFKKVVTLKVGYGGVATLREVKLKRIDSEKDGGLWRVDKELGTRMFSYRTITRSQAAALKKPKRKE